MEAERLAELYDRQLIRDTLLRHCANFDAACLDQMDQVWAEDCRTDYGPERGGVLIGRDAFLERLVDSLRQFRWTYHHLGDSLIELRGDTATAKTSVLGWHELLSGERCWVGGTYHDELRRSGDQWLIWSRETVVSGADGTMAQQAWSRLRRELPKNSS